MSLAPASPHRCQKHRLHRLPCPVCRSEQDGQRLARKLIRELREELGLPAEPAGSGEEG
jgi:hypothetical protein